MANIYEKLQTIRAILAESGIKKTGQNLYSKYSYLSLEDFLPQANKLMKEHKLSSYTTFTTDTATLTLVDIEKPDATIVFSSPTAAVQLKGCHPVQNLGAVQTYLRRYLWITALEISESDIIDNTTDTSSKPVPQATVQAANTAVPGKYVIDYDNPNLHDELKKLWHFANWQDDDLQPYIDKYLTQHKKDKAEAGEYMAILTDLQQYLVSTGMMIDDKIPF